MTLGLTPGDSKANFSDGARPSSWSLNKALDCLCQCSPVGPEQQPACAGLQDTPWFERRVMDSRACSCIWLPEWGRVTVPVTSGTVTDVTHQAEVNKGTVARHYQSAHFSSSS